MDRSLNTRNTGGLFVVSYRFVAPDWTFAFHTKTRSHLKRMYAKSSLDIMTELNADKDIFLISLQASRRLFNFWRRIVDVRLLHYWTLDVAEEAK